MGQARDVEDGFYTAKETIESGQALINLREWVREQNTDPEKGEKKLDSLLEQVDARL
jgi:anthranilate phosphoribosyltransferase